MASNCETTQYSEIFAGPCVADVAPELDLTDGSPVKMTLLDQPAIRRMRRGILADRELHSGASSIMIDQLMNWPLWRSMRKPTATEFLSYLQDIVRPTTTAASFVFIPDSEIYEGMERVIRSSYDVRSVSDARMPSGVPASPILPGYRTPASLPSEINRFQI